MVVTQPLDRREFWQMEKCEKALQKTEFRTVDILQPHGCKSYSGHDVRKVNHSAEKASFTDSGSDNDGKKQCQGEHNHSAKKPDAKQIPHRNAEQRRI